MKKAFAITVLALLAALLLPAACGDDSPSINSKCEKFCDALVESIENCMDSSECEEYVYIDSAKEARKECELSCTQTLDELGKSDKEAVEDCLDCLAESAGSSDDINEFMANIYDEDECESECNDDDPDDDDPWGDLFEDDFFEDFDENLSSGDPDVDVDADADMDADGDGDGDTDVECSYDDVTACTDDYTACSEACGDDYTCINDCYYIDFCDCLDAAGCDTTEYGC